MHEGLFRLFVLFGPIYNSISLHVTFKVITTCSCDETENKNVPDTFPVLTGVFLQEPGQTLNYSDAINIL